MIITPMKFMKKDFPTLMKMQNQLTHGAEDVYQLNSTLPFEHHRKPH